MVDYYSFIVHTLDRQRFDLRVSLKNIKQLVGEMKDVSVKGGEMITLTLYVPKDGVVEPYKIQMDGEEYDRMMQWMNFMLDGGL